ncbi:hypothetical protein BST97_04700 [Nonlabens spongiae]|uniref:Uncharacterized protein n=2 Tax=Nonlabens spongiae TaxID=331648 RepID=A0A1W6MIE3_9FLAO|nr:hypothetical protein BST97_04700 [Nonlabens spongiae]
MISILGCQDFTPKSKTPKVEFVNKTAFEKKAKEIVAFEDLGISYLGIGHKVDSFAYKPNFILRKPEIDYDDSLQVQGVLDKLEILIDAEVKNLSDFQGVQITFEKQTEVSPDFIKEKNLIYNLY